MWPATSLPRNLVGGVLVDTQGPTVAFTVPAADSVVLGQISVEASATDATGIARVEFYVDGAIQSTDTAAPYAFNWDTAAFNEGVRQLRAVATDGAGRASEVTRNVTVTRFVPPPDVDGPAIANARLDATPLANGVSVTRNATVSATVTDRSGVARVELLLDGAVVSVATGTSSFTSTLDISALANGPRTLGVRAFDSLNNVTTLSYNISIAHAAPPAPTLTQPQNGLSTRFGSVVAAGTAAAGTSVQLFVNSVASGAPLIADSNGAFGATLTLANGQNRIQAQASDAHGSSPLSPIVTVTVDTAVPLPAANLVATAQSAGIVRLAWVRSTDPSVVGYDVYRSSASFTALTDAVRANTAPINNLLFEDMPRADGEYFYRVVAVNAARTPSDATNVAQGRSDSTLPRASSVVYQPQGRVDPVTGRFGQGRVDVTLTVSEPLQATPYLALGVEGAAPISVVLNRQSDTVYIGSFTVDAATASGVATAIFSARDAVGNRGTEVDIGRTVGIDTTGPAVTAIALTPAAPIKADTASNVTATFTVSEPLKSGTTPDVLFLLSGAGRTPTPITGMTALNPTSWRGTFALPANAGASAPEFLSFTFRALDELDNVSTLVSAPNSFQVYQGNLPPSAIPAGLRAEARPAGRVRLTWQTVAEAASYQIYRHAPGESALTALVRSTTLEHIDATTQDGVYRYAVASVRQFNQQETLSAQSAPVEATSRRDAPGAPQNLQLTLTGQGIRAVWQAPVGGNVATYNIYRAPGLQITSTDALRRCALASSAPRLSMPIRQQPSMRTS